jgi:hypothetical protein
VLRPFELHRPGTAGEACQLPADLGDDAVPYAGGTKGAGEGSLIPVSPAVANALMRLTGVRMRDLPLTPERVWRALRARASNPLRARGPR